ncbi:MAG TPA: glycosyltransferase family 1 protein [Acidimicrobiales bacterium]|nr:glycosyltransferase family 1 protein [Acidimicrobiales bacterium]
MSEPAPPAASPPPDPLAAGVLLVVEQLRRQVPGGIGTYANGLLHGLAELSGRDRPMLRLHASREVGRRDPLEAYGLPVHASPLPSPLLVRAWDLGLARIGKGAALVHSVSLATPASAPPLVVTVHDVAWRSVPEAYPRRGQRWHEAALRRTAKRADAVVVPSRQVAEELADAGVGLGEERVTVIEEGADHLPRPDLDAAGLVLGRLGVTGEFLLSVGTLEPRKNLRRLFAAYGAARPRLAEPWPLVVVGPPGWGESSGRPPEGVVFAGRLGDAALAGLYALARGLAYVPLKEGFGLPVVEAMRLGTPVVASPVPSAAGAALEVDPYDVDSIADGLVAVAGDETLRRRLSEDGQARAAVLTWRATAAAHVALWRRVAASRG